MSKKNIFLGVISLMLPICIFLGYRFLNQPHRDIEKESASVELSSNALGDAFKNEPTTANTRFLDKTIIVSGTVAEVDGQTVVLDNIVFARFKSPVPVKKDTFVRIKGRCIGYDDLLEEVRLEQCSLLPK